MTPLIPLGLVSVASSPPTEGWELGPFLIGALLELLTPWTDSARHQDIHLAITRDAPEGDHDRQMLLSLLSDYRKYSELPNDINHLVYIFLSVGTTALLIRFGHHPNLSSASIVALIALVLVGVFAYFYFRGQDPVAYSERTTMLRVNVHLRRVPQVCVVSNLAIALGLGLAAHLNW